MSQNLPLQPCVQENLIAPEDHSLVMAAETKPVTSISIIILVRLDIEKAYQVGLEIAKENNAVFQGMWPWSLQNPNRDALQIGFIADVTSINKIIEKVKSQLNLTNENLLYSAIPSVRPAEKRLPSIMTT